MKDFMSALKILLLVLQVASGILQLVRQWKRKKSPRSRV
ncbi:hypothetical protein N007_18545 [Alicyclobacillus acidoterrestris ATCC 49025]|nr:hypothetical protein N007_18545 [Alicyclobacillus acidoterrestris ATCC 49025]